MDGIRNEEQRKQWVQELGAISQDRFTLERLINRLIMTNTGQSRWMAGGQLTCNWIRIEMTIFSWSPRERERDNDSARETSPSPIQASRIQLQQFGHTDLDQILCGISHVDTPKIDKTAISPTTDGSIRQPNSKILNGFSLSLTQPLLSHLY